MNFCQIFLSFFMFITCTDFRHGLLREHRTGPIYRERQKVAPKEFG